MKRLMENLINMKDTILKETDNYILKVDRLPYLIEGEKSPLAYHIVNKDTKVIEHETSVYAQAHDAIGKLQELYEDIHNEKVEGEDVIMEQDEEVVKH